MLLMGGMLVASCSSSSAPKVSFGQQTVLAVGDTVELAPRKMLVTFSDVTQDSRCPSDVVCIQAGSATILLDTVLSGVHYPTELTLGQGAREGNLRHQGVLFRFTLNPYPKAAQPIAKTDYRLLLTMEP
jgi:hypothetical protein